MGYNCAWRFGTPPSSSGLGHQVLNLEIGVQFPVGVPPFLTRGLRCDRIANVWFNS